MNVWAIFKSLSGWFRVSLFAAILGSLYILRRTLEKETYETLYNTITQYIVDQIPFLSVVTGAIRNLLIKFDLEKPVSFLFQSVFNFVLVIFFFALIYFIVTLAEDIRKRIVRWYHKIDSSQGVMKERNEKLIKGLENTSEPSKYCITHPKESDGKEKTPSYVWNPSKSRNLDTFIDKYGKDNFRIGIILAGGGAKGTYQAGSMTAIYKFLESINALQYVRMISGTSIGTWNAMFWLTENIKNGVHRSWWHTIKPKRIVQPAYYIPYYSNYIISNKSWQGYFSGLFTTDDYKTYMDPDEVKQPVHFYFTRANAGSARLEVSTNNKNIVDCDTRYGVNNIADVKESVFMSMDIPPLFRRMKKGHEWFEDGGVIDNLPIKFATKYENCQLLFILPLNASFEEKVCNRSIFKRLMRVMDIRQGALEADALKDMTLYNDLVIKGSDRVKHKNKTTAFIICPKPPLEINTAEFWKTKASQKAFDLAYCATKEEIEKFDFSPDYNEPWMTLYDRDGNISYKKYL